MARTTNRITSGTGVYACACCGRKTRDTGRGDNESAGLCAECFDLAGEENHHSDNGGKTYSSVENIANLYWSIKARGDASAFDSFMKALGVDITKAPAKPAKRETTADMSKVQGVWFKPTVVATIEDAGDEMFTSMRRRPVLAKNKQGQLVVCSARTARKHGWETQKEKAAVTKAAPKNTKREQRLAKLQEVDHTPANRRISAMLAAEKSVEDMLG